MNPIGRCSQGYIDKSEEIIYTINFQNIGSISADRVQIIDTLPEALDIKTLNLLKISHNYDLEIVNNKVLKFNFLNINLLPKIVNDSLSKGFVIFKIKPKSNLLNETKILNTASIYFDFNLPINTNSILLKILDKKYHQQKTTLNLESCKPIVYEGIILDKTDTIMVIKDNIFGCDSNLVINFKLDPFDKQLLFSEEVGIYTNEIASTYQWLNCDNNFSIIFNENNKNYTPKNTGNFAVKFVDGNCIDTSNCFSFIVSDVNNLKNEILKIYPNPFKNNLVVDVFSNKIISIEIFDSLGKNQYVDYSTENNSTYILKTESLNQGIYFLKLNFKDKVISKIVIKN